MSTAGQVAPAGEGVALAPRFAAIGRGTPLTDLGDRVATPLQGAVEGR